MPPLLCTANDLDVLARTIDGEAGNQPLEAKVAVAWAVRNRMAWGHAWWGAKLADVCQKPLQFQAWMAGNNRNRILALDTDGKEYQIAYTVARAVMAGDIPDPTGGSTTYKETGTPAMWDDAVAGVDPRRFGVFEFWRLSPDGHCLPFVIDGLGGTDNGRTTSI